MFNYLKNSFLRKKARRITKEYPPIIEDFDLGSFGIYQFANWSNPLVPRITIDRPMIEFYNQFIKDGDLAIDIGANIGDTTVPMAISTSKNGLTIGFDPNPYVFKILEKNSTLNKGLYNLRVHQNAISTKDEEFYFISSEASFGNGGISPTQESIHGRFVYPNKIHGVNLKLFLEQNYPEWLNKLSLIKIDTEGYDKEIIKSIHDLISKYKPVIIAESFGKASDDDKLELFDVIEKNGYNIFYFEDFNINLKVERLLNRSDIIKFKTTVNIYAVPA